MNIHLAISFDKTYLVHFYALASSIFHNNSSEKLIFHCIIKGIPESEKANLISYVESNKARIYFYDIDEVLITQFSATITGTWTLAVYYKMFFPLLVPQYLDRLLYIDTDTLVINNLSALFSENLGTYPLGAVYDCYVKKQEELGITKENNYFNSGMLLFNLPEWRKQSISEKAIAYLQDHPEKIKFVDQDALNAVLINNWKKLSKNYNLIYSYLPQDTSKKNIHAFIKEAVIIHFTLHRPWNLLCKNRLRSLYSYYLKRSPKRKEKIILDFSFGKILPYFKIQFIEWYLDREWLQYIWRQIKRSILNSHTK